MKLSFMGFIPLENLKKSDISYDTAIPQEWNQMVHDAVKHHYPEGVNISQHFVWVYPDDGAIFGGAMAVTFEGSMILQYFSEA